MKAAGIIIATFFIWINAAGQVFDTESLLYSGSADKHINLVILGDGYTSSELTKFVADATNFTNAFFNETPFLNYKNFFNVYIIKVPSIQSGASHPGTATDVTEPVIPVTNVNNYFGSTFDSYNIHRLLVATKFSAIISVLAANFPAYDQALILVNSPEYGGSGGNPAVASTHSSSVQIAVHELGHSFSGLKDEYWAGDVYAAEGINMTKEVSPLIVRWKNWYGINQIGIYKHGTTGVQALWYRPHQNCKMRYLGPPFCSVCTEGIIERIHSLVTPVESYIPADLNITGTSFPLIFKLNLITPEPNTLKRNWLLNGSLFGKKIDEVSVKESNLSSGTNTLTATVEDTTEMLRVDNHAIIHISTVSWYIDKTITGIRKITNSSSEVIIDLYPNPATDYINIKLQGETKGKIKLELYDVLGKRHKSYNLNNSVVNTISIEDLVQGVYLAKIYISNNLISTRMIIRK